MERGVKRESSSSSPEAQTTSHRRLGHSSNSSNGTDLEKDVAETRKSGATEQSGKTMVKDESVTSINESNTDTDSKQSEREASRGPLVDNSRTTASKSTNKQASTAKKAPKAPAQLIPHYPRAEAAALATFETLETNWHQYKYIGKSKIQEDAMACECQFRPGDPLDKACGPRSDCINRLTLVECVDGECRCRGYCQNQRFQKRQYANVHIVKTEMKGFGLRAAGPISRDDFIYEYIGEVVSEPSFMKRMRDYGDEGIEHFYFMMLQKDEFLDATKKGGIGRFANHSCNPNCYVARWVVGTRLRMGIFAKRDIQMDEELTFNYNVDRYGHDAQKCYCGEPNCVGYIGGKTQTDLGAMDSLYIDALGIADEVDRLELRGNKRKKGKKLGEDFNPILKPMEEGDEALVLNAIRQTTNRNILTKLITRISITEDASILREITRLRGLTLMTPTLEEYKDDFEVQSLILESVAKWPFVNRNKIEDAKIEPLLTTLCASNDQSIAGSAQALLTQWSLLETVYRIPKKIKRDLEDDEHPQNIYIVSRDEEDERPLKRIRREEPILAIKPLGVARGQGNGTSSFRTDAASTTPTIATVPSTPAGSNLPSKGSLSQIIEQAMEDARRAQAEQEVHAARAAAEEQRLKEEKAKKKQKAKEKRRMERGVDGPKSGSKEGSPSKTANGESAASNKEKKLLKLVGASVVHYLSQHRSRFSDPEEFKRHAKEITQKIAEKEMKGQTYQSNAKLEALSDEKRAKIKDYVKSYVGKLRGTGTSSNSGSKDPRKQRQRGNGNGDGTVGEPQHATMELASDDIANRNMDNVALFVSGDEDSEDGALDEVSGEADAGKMDVD